jgi:CRISPR-associated protein Csx16
VIWFVSRHPGAREWAIGQGLQWDAELQHLSGSPVSRGDRVYGTLPCHLAALVCSSGAEYWHLEVPVSAAMRGSELSAEELQALGARFVRYAVKTMEPE